ncbi:hypothetical protein PQ460_18400 [Paenibacillus sp. KACC 21273]|uniref:hypothetical protein n=1 Tax=Paenibacillus sp. KACC 21273 TaxID=3025665 RepID=UPI00236608B5|nr:hypothetical protein [Paenibacillus sp. KACC 21273]WDF49943.1 hypothetical protein PQ460_18400 [Paenibacillus sp. KACC 21273]
MDYFEKYPIGNCCVCSQGWVVIVKEISIPKYFVYCNECETEWAHPEDFILRQKSSRFKYEDFSEPNDKEVIDIGWYKYIDQTMLQ